MSNCQRLVKPNKIQLKKHGYCIFEIKECCIFKEKGFYFYLFKTYKTLRYWHHIKCNLSHWYKLNLHKCWTVHWLKFSQRVHYFNLWTTFVRHTGYQLMTWKIKKFVEHLPQFSLSHNHCWLINSMSWAPWANGDIPITHDLLQYYYQLITYLY